jgi:hypothetical protein
MDVSSDPNSGSLTTAQTTQGSALTTLSLAEIEMDIESLEKLLNSPAFKFITFFDANRKKEILKVITSTSNIRERVSEITRVITEVSAFAGVSAGTLLALLKAYQALAASNPAAVQQLIKFLEAFVIK